MLTLSQIKFCAAECFRQQSGELSVADMCYAFNLAKHQNWPTMDFILQLGRLVDPRNKNGFRRAPVTKHGNLVIGVPFNHIPQALYNLICALIDDRLSPEEAYQEFELVHPFIDGNGRVGAILFNFLRNTLTDPIPPPEFKN